MLPEPDLFSHVKTASLNINIKNAEQCKRPDIKRSQKSGRPSFHGKSVSAMCDAEQESVEEDSVTVACEDENSRPGHMLEGLSHNSGGEMREVTGKLKCDPYNWANHLFLKDRQKATDASEMRFDPRERKTRTWYLTVIVLLYVGLITSFCLNVSLLLKTYPGHAGSGRKLEHQLAEPGEPLQENTRKSEPSQLEFSYSTSCLVADPCDAGSYYSCPVRECRTCDVGSFQPQWGQTSCWPCPPNTTTDGPGTISPAQCKHTECIYRSTPGLAIVESPNYPADFPAQTSCHWKVQPGHQGSLLLILPSLSLPPHCSHTLSVRKTASRGSEDVFSSCSSTPEPVLLTVEGGELLVEFTAGDGDYSAGGFQLSIISIPDDLRHIIDVVKGQGSDTQLERIQQTVWGDNQQGHHLMSHLLNLLREKQPRTTVPEQGDNPLIEVIEETGEGGNDIGQIIY